MANVTITQLPAAGTITGDELVPVVQNGQTVQTTAAALAGSPVQTQTFLTKDNEPTLANSRYLAVGTGLGLTDDGAQSYLQINLNGASGSLEVASNGIIAKTALDTVTARTLATSGAGLSVTNGDGGSGNPTFSLTGLPLALANTSGTSFLAVVGGSTIAGRTLTGTANQIDISSGNGSDSPIFSIASNPILPGAGSVTVPRGSTAERPAGTTGMLRYNTDSGDYEVVDSLNNWVAISAGGVTPTANNLAGGAAGDIPYQVSAGITTFLSAASGVLVGGVTPSYSTTPTLTGTNFTGIPNGALDNSSLTIGSTNIALGATSTTLAGLSTVTVTGNPTNPLELAPKQYVDAVAEGLHVQAPAQAATPDALATITGGSVTYDNGTSGVGATLTLGVALTTLDGYSLQDGDRIVVKDESTQAHNGIYTWATGGTVLTRATDFDTPEAIAGGDFVFCQNGTLYAGTGWVQTDTVTTVGTDPIVFLQFSGAGTYTAGTGLTLTGTQFSLTSPVLSTLGGTGLDTYTAGDLLYYSSGTALTKLGIGTSTYLLTSSGSAPQWSDPSGVTVGTATNAGTATNVAGGTAGAIVYNSGAGSTTFLSLGTSTYLVRAGASAPEYVDPANVSVGTATNVSGGTAGALVYNTASGTSTFLSLGFSGYLITAGASAPQYTDPASVTVGTATNATDATNAANVGTTATSTNATFYPTFVDATSGNNAIEVDSDLTYNPSTNTLTAGTVTATTGIFGGTF